MWEWSCGVMVRGRVVEIGGLIDREFQTLRSTVELGSRAITTLMIWVVNIWNGRV